MFDQSVKERYGCNPKLPSQAQIAEKAEALFPGLPHYQTYTEVGIEIELEKVNNIKPSVCWKGIKDGSLKDKGVEFITPPLKDRNVIFALQEFTESVLKPNPNSYFSHRCSIHVHINVSKLKVGQLRALLASYLVLEKYYFSLVAPHREGNTYCFPLADTGITWVNLTPGNFGDNFKYSAVNIHHLVDFGTLEFRQHSGTKDMKELSDWISYITALYVFVLEHSPEQIEDQIMKLNTTSKYLEFLMDVFKDKCKPFLQYDQYTMMRENVMAAKLFLSE